VKPLSLLLLLLASAFVQAESAPTLAHKVVAADRERGHVLILNDKGETVWEYSIQHDAHDLQLLPNGNLLIHLNHTKIVEVTPEKKIVWEYVAKPKMGYRGAVEVHAFQRLDNGLTMIAETGNQRIIEVDREGKIIHEIPLTIKNPHPHRDTRLVRKLDTGNYLVCHEGDGVVREYDPKGKVVWSYALDLAGRPRSGGHGPEGHGTEVYSAIRLKNGNTLMGGGNNNRVIEVNPKGEIVWSIDQKELPSITLAWVTMVQVLPNGNIIISNCHAGANQPQLIEVTREKKVVGTMQDHKRFGNSLAASQVVVPEGNVLR